MLESSFSTVLMPKRDEVLDLAAQLNSVQITAEDMWALCEESEKYHRDNPGPGDEITGFMLVAKAVKKGEWEKAHAMWWRMNALSKIVVDDGAHGWTLPEGPDGAVPTRSAMFAAAAVHPLIKQGEELVFDRASFLACVLELAEPETFA